MNVKKVLLKQKIKIKIIVFQLMKVWIVYKEKLHQIQLLELYLNVLNVLKLMLLYYQ